MSLTKESIKGPVLLRQHNRFFTGLFLCFFLLVALFGGQPETYSDGIIDQLNDITSLYYRGRFTEALQKLGQIVVKDPNNDQARLNLARLLKESGKQQEALIHLIYLVKKDPANPRYRSVLIETAYLTGKPEVTVDYIYPDETDSQILYWTGLVLTDLGNINIAKDALAESIKMQSYNPMAHYALGLLEQKGNNIKNAFAHFQQALAQEPNLKRSYFPLAKNCVGIQKQKTSYNLLDKAGSTEPWNFPVNSSFLSTVETTEPKPQESEENSEKPPERIAPPEELAKENRDAVPEIRIGLVSKVKQLRIKTGGNYRLSIKGKPLLTGGKNEALLFVRTSWGTEVYDPKGKLLIKSRYSIILSYEAPDVASSMYDVKFASGSSWSRGNPRIYRGGIELIHKNSGLTVVNRVNLEEYLYSVVPSEIPASWPAAVLEAQAVAARTYALANLGRYKFQGFDLLATPTSQVYNGVTQEAASVIEAVNATRGMILTFKGKPAGAFYYDNSGGYTESGAFVWGSDRPYLRALPEKPLAKREQPLTPDELADWLSSQPDSSTFREGYFVRGAYRWTVWITREQLESRIRPKAKIGRIKAVIPMERGISGRVKRVMVKGTAGSYIVSGSSLPYRLGGLRSTLFVVQPKVGRDGLPESFIFNGGGWGHGVGMSQSGAAGMALDGASVSEILAYYYPGTELVQKY